jgi:hypothetical protein
VARRIRLRWVIVLYCAAAQAYVWHEFLTHTPGTSPAPAEIVVPALAEIVTALLLAAWVIVKNRSIAWAVASTFNAIFLLVGQFSIWYLSYGGGENWSPRLTRLDGRYRMQVLAGTFERYESAVNERLMRASTYEWPHAFARFAAPAEDILSRYGSNHIHAVPGDRVAELRAVCRYLDIDFDGIGDVA